MENKVVIDEKIATRIFETIAKIISAREGIDIKITNVRKRDTEQST